MIRLARTLAACAVLALAPGLVQAKEWKKVVIATEGAYAPYNMHAPDGTLIGFEIDLAKNLCERAKVTCEFIAQDWNGIIPGLTAGKYDAIMSGMSITPKRMEVIAFTRNYSQAPTTFGVLKNGPLATMPMNDARVSLDDKAQVDAMVAALTPVLRGKIVAAQVSTIQADLLNTYFKGVVELRTYPTTEEHDLDLQAGRVDALLASSAQLRGTIEKKGGEVMKTEGPLITGGLLGKGTGIGLRKSDTDLKEMFDAAIDAAIKDGTVKALSIKWFKTDISPAS